ncbi:MAG TPA: hypothetical protein VE825_11200 [Terriglobales bacterium]|jgi:hypothetical protein|nr:hypothetical protein [Terriglobales bacterium]
MLLEYVKGTPFLLKRHPQFRESWLRDRIADDPAMLGLGSARVVAIERRHPHAGRLDLLLQQGQQRRYVVEIMLGKLDESHLVRTLEYWDAEQQASPALEHVAVLVAEELPPRLVRVLALLRGTLPLVVLQMTATRVAGQFSLCFTRVLEGPGRARQTPSEPRPAGRAIWERKGCAAAVATLDACLSLLAEIAPGLHLAYHRSSVAALPAPGAVPLLVFSPQRHFLRLEIQPPDPGAYWRQCEAADWQELEAERLLHAVQVLLFPGEVARKRACLRRVLLAAWKRASLGVEQATRPAAPPPCPRIRNDDVARPE